MSEATATQAAWAKIVLEDTEDIDFFSPPREDWLSGSDAYLR